MFFEVSGKQESVLWCTEAAFQPLFVPSQSTSQNLRGVQSNQPVKKGVGSSKTSLVTKPSSPRVARAGVTVVIIIVWL